MRKLQDEMSYPPRGMRGDRAAAYLGISHSLFLDMLRTGEIQVTPARFRGAVVYDRLELDRVLEDMKDSGGRPNSIDERLGVGHGEGRAGLSARVHRSPR